MAELLDLEIFDQLSAGRSNHSMPFLGIDAKGVISLSSALVEERNLTVANVISFARSGKTWYVSFTPVTGRQPFPVRQKKNSKTALFATSRVTAKELFTAFPKRAVATNLRLLVTDEQASHGGAHWFRLALYGSVPAVAAPSGAKPAAPETSKRKLVATAPESSIISPKTAERLAKHREQLQGGTEAPRAAAPAADESASPVAAPLVRADKASDERLQARYDVLVAILNPNQDQARELGRISGELSRRKEAVNG